MRNARERTQTELLLHGQGRRDAGALADGFLSFPD